MQAAAALMKTSLTTAVLFALLLCCACASDKKISPPPHSQVIDPTKPVDIRAARQLLESATVSAGEARTVTAYDSADACSEVSSFYSNSMNDAHWSRTSQRASDRSFVQSWSYMRRTVYIVGAADEPTGCRIMVAIYDRARRRNK